MKWLSLIPSLAVLLLSCSGSPPVILNSDWMVVYTYDLTRGGIYTELDFFAQLDDEDGLEDITGISIHRDDQGWAWELSPDEWISSSEDGENWIGANGLTRGGALPGGEYRLLVIDRSGQREEQIFRIDEPDLIPGVHVFPRAQVQGDFLRIDSAGHEQVVIWFYNERAELVSEQYVAGGLYPLGELLRAEELQIVSWFMLYYQDEKEGFGLKTGPYLMKDPDVSDKPPVSTSTPGDQASASATLEDS